MAVRHITNPKQGKDEGLRLVWFDESGVGEVEMADWPRRDKMKREGKTVYAKEDEWVGVGRDLMLGTQRGKRTLRVWSIACGQGFRWTWIGRNSAARVVYRV